MKGRSRLSLFRPASWSFATKATVIPSLGLVLISVVLAILVNQTVRGIEIEALQTDFKELGETQSHRLMSLLVREVRALDVLAQNGITVRRVEERNAAAREGMPAAADLEADAAVREQIDFFLRTHREFKLVLITDGAGRLVAGSPDLGQVEYGDEEWYSLATGGANGGLYLSDRRDTTSIAGAQGVEIALPVLDEGHQPIGVLYAVWDVANDPEVAPLGVVKSRRVTILDREGVVIADAVEGTVGQVVFGPELLSEFQANLSGGTVGHDEVGKRTLMGYSGLVQLTWLTEFRLLTAQFPYDVLTPIRRLGWTAVVSQDVKSALVGAQVLVRRIVGLLAAATVVIIAAAFVFARTLIAPLGHLTEAARSIGAGQLETPIPRLGEDEVGQLADVLRGTVARLIQRVDQLRAATEVTHAAQATLDMDQMLQGVTDGICDQFGFARARIYLLNPGEEVLMLRAASGYVDRSALEELRRVPVNAPNVIGEAVHFSRPHLASGARSSMGSGSELAVPLRLGEELLGALCVAAQELDAFGAEDISMLGLLADQVSTSMQNARLFEQREASLQYIEALNRRLTREGWVDYLGERGQLRYALRPEDAERVWPASLTEAARSGEPIVGPQVSEDGQAMLAVPILLRGEVIGTLGVKRPPGHQWSDEEIGLVQAVAERVALIAEGIRLLDEADRTTQREQLVSSVSAKLQRTTELDSLIQTALSELSGALGSDNISLQIGSPPGAANEAGSESESDGKAES